MAVTVETHVIVSHVDASHTAHARCRTPFHTAVSRRVSQGEMGRPIGCVQQMTVSGRVSGFGVVGDLIQVLPKLTMENKEETGIENALLATGPVGVRSVRRGWGCGPGCPAPPRWSSRAG
jgi:hypothetical protein